MKKNIYSEEKANSVKTIIVNDFQTIEDGNFGKIFDEYLQDKRTISFIDYYNSIVLDRKKIEFGTFKSKWAIQGMKKKVYSYFDNNYNDIINEIIKVKNIDSFYKNYCCKERDEAIFCCKLFHVILPNEFPLVDNNILKHFKLSLIYKITSYKIMKQGYELFINENKDILDKIKKILSLEKYKYIRINELSNFRIIDMIYWYLLNRKRK